MKIKIFLFAAIFLTVATSCKDFLQENPKDFLSPNNLPVTEADCDLMLNGAIGVQRNGNLYERCLVFLAGVSADDMDVNYTSGDRFEIDRYSYLKTNQYVELVWRSSYSIINEANIMIAKIPQTNLSDAVKEKYVASAKFMRAFWYFHLVRLYGDKCILLDKPVEDFSAALNMPTASIESVYKLIKEDIDYAVGAGTFDGHRLPTTDWPAAGRPTYGAARLLQANIYMTLAGYPLKQTDKWQTAREASLEVMNTKRYKLAKDLNAMWLIVNEQDPEFIYSIQNQLPDAGSMWPVQVRPDGWMMFIGSDFYYKKYFVDKDLRRDAYHILTWNSKPYTTFTGAAPYIKKYADMNRTNLNDYAKRTDTNWPVFRMSEAYLMFAESENEVNGPTPAALDALNATRLRAGLDALTGLSKEQFRQELMDERARELTFEIKRRYDLQRWGLLDQVLSADPHSKTNFHMAEHEYYPAPNREVMLNPNLGK